MQIPLSIRIAVGGFVILVLGALAGWFFYLHSQKQAVTAVETGRALGTTAPSFGATTGSTQANQAIATQMYGSNSPSTSRTSSSTSLWEVDSAPVAGMGFVVTATDEYLYYVERANGYLFSAHPSARSVVRLTNTLNPKIYSAQFSNDGSFIERSLDSTGNITTFLGTISATSSVSTSGAFETVTGMQLEQNIRAISMNHVTKSIFYLTNNPQGGVNGFSAQWDGTKKKQVFSSLIASWNPNILDDGTTILLESPSDDMAGYAYKLGANGSLIPIVRAVPGLTILPKTASPLLIYGSSSGGSMSLSGIATGTPISIPLATLTDKCVWLPGKSEIVYCAVPNGTIRGYFIDAWYQGYVHSSDDWWEIDLSTGTTQRIYSPSTNNVTIDVSAPTIDASGNYISFINAIDQSLWVLHVAQ